MRTSPSSSRTIRASCATGPTSAAVWSGSSATGRSRGSRPLHSDVDIDQEGTGLGSELVRRALEDIRARGLLMVPYCPFIQQYLRDHPEELALVGADPALPE